MQNCYYVPKPALLEPATAHTCAVAGSNLEPASAQNSKEKALPTQCVLRNLNFIMSSNCDLFWEISDEENETEDASPAPDPRYEGIMAMLDNER